MDAMTAYRCLHHTWPALDHYDVAGWTARVSRGGYNRTNSVLPGRFLAGRDLDDAIVDVETIYRARDLAPTFMVIERAEPHDLDLALAGRGYGAITPSDVLAKRVSGNRNPPEAVVVTEQAGPDWLSLYLSTQNSEKTAECLEILSRLPERRAFFVVHREGEPAGVGLAALHENAVGIDCIFTHPARRRSGVAAGVLAAIEAWAAAERAEWLVLAVVAANQPAVALYHGLGFEKIGGYWYRIAPG